jgi:hypothetical protein
MEAVRLKSLLLDSQIESSAVTKYVGYTWYSGYRAKPKKAWFDLVDTSLFIAFCQLVLISPSLCKQSGYPNLAIHV